MNLKEPSETLELIGNASTYISGARVTFQIPQATSSKPYVLPGAPLGI